jgi:hypothetical protein
MFAEAAAGRGVSSFQTTIPAPRTPPPNFHAWQPTQQLGAGPGQIPVTDQTPANPYGMNAEAAERYRSKAFRLSLVSTVAVLAVMGYSVWATTRAQNHADQQTANDAAKLVPTFSTASFPGPQTASTPSSEPSHSAQTSAADNGSSTQSLLTPAGARGVIKQILAVSGGSRVVSMTIYDDHASFDVVKKDDPTVYDTYDYNNGKAAFSMTGRALDDGEPTLDPYQVKWDALPGLLKDANSTLNVKNPNDHYVIVDSDIIDHNLRLRVYVGDDYRSGYLLADLKGKVQERYPQE